MGGAIVLVFLFWIAIWGGLGAGIASNKGISGGTGFALGALLGLIGIIIILVMKPQRPVAGPPMGGPWAIRECPFCKSGIRRDASVCPYCQRESKPWSYRDGYWWTTDDVGNQYWLDERTGQWTRHGGLTLDPPR